MNIASIIVMVMMMVLFYVATIILAGWAPMP
jgi:hypothetical protein